MINKTNLVEFDGKYYSFDLDVLMQWVSTTPLNERNIATEVTQVYPLNDSGTCDIATEKQITESKPSKNEVMNNIRYDIVKDMMSLIISPVLQGDGTIARLTSVEDMTLGQKLCWNTLVEANILVEISEND